MLDFLRKRKRNWIIIVFLGAIIVSFALFVGSGKFGDPLAAEIANINGEIISQREFAVYYERELQRYRELLKGSLSPEMLKGLNIKGNLVETLVQKKLLLQEARSLGLTATDDDLAIHLTKTPEFQLGGRFSKDRYLQVLQANRLVPAQFEEEQREQLTIQRLYSIILDSVHVTDAEVRERYRIEQEKINLNFLKLAVGDFAAQVKLTDDDIKKHYERNKDALKEPLKIQIEYLAYPFEQFTAAMDVSEKEIEEYYKANLNTRFHHPKEAKVRYISVGVPPGADAAAKKTVKSRADAIVTEARAGKDFAQLAKRESNDPSAEKGGDVGWLTAGQMPPQIEKAIFTLAKGGVSDPIESPAGFQIFKVEDVKDEKTSSLSEARPEIVKILKTEKAKREAAKAADADREKALSGTDLTKLSQDSRVPLKVTRLFANGEILPEIGENQEFYKNAFALSANATSPIVEGRDAYYILRLKQRTEPSVPPLETVSARIEKGLRESKGYELALQRGNHLLEQLKKEKDIAKIAQENNLKLEETGWFPRSAPQLPKIGDLAEIKGEPIALSRQKPIPDRLYSQKEALYLLAFKDSEGADMEKFEKEKEAIKRQAIAESRQRALVKFMEGLKSKAQIKMNTAFLEES
ncbi:MAG TPA: SurA N-terminal domain-containing protein [Candidatus Binatia bacterium]|nr:SurA N-terminal domain-containing protein [Candidatus Binatia bacterium]